ARLSKNLCVQLTSPPLGPEPINFNCTPYVGSHAVNLRNSVAYSSGVKSPQPHDSLPTPQKLTLCGSRNPFFTRSVDQVVRFAGALQYSSHSRNTGTSRLRTLAARYGCAPTSLQNETNSSVPN